MSDEDGKYPNLIAPGTLKRIGVEAAPMIAWGPAYRAWTPEVKVVYLEKLASSLNQAVELMQIDRDRLSKIAYQQDAQIRAMRKSAEEQDRTMQQLITTANAEKESRLQEIVAMREMVSQLKREVRLLKRVAQ